MDRKEKIIVGVNDYVAEENPIEILQIDDSVAEPKSEQLRKLRAERSAMTKSIAASQLFAKPPQAPTT